MKKYEKRNFEYFLFDHHFSGDFLLASFAPSDLNQPFFTIKLKDEQECEMNYMSSYIKKKSSSYFRS